MHHYTMIASLSNLLCHIHTQNNTSPSHFRVCEVTDVPEIVFLITHIPLIQIMYARVTRPLDQQAGARDLFQGSATPDYHITAIDPV